jgi:anaerobic magnesium-protoporphyrin IX monomethyl ester cyclase
VRVMLADVPARQYGFDASYPNMGVLYLISSLRARPPVPDLQLRHLDARCDLRAHAAAVREFAPDIYGLSLSSLAMPHLPEIAEAVRAAAPGAVIICGGPGPTADPAGALACEQVEACVLGEGEETLAAVVEAVAAGHHLREAPLPGTAVRTEEGVLLGEPRPLVADLDSLPFPAWDLVDFAAYPGMHLRRAGPETSVVISRGCPYNCCFCSNPVWKLGRPWLRARSAANIAEEVELLYRRGVREIYFASDELNHAEGPARELCEAMAKLGRRDLHFQCNLRAHPLSDDLARALREMNCWLVHLGIESANDRVLAGIGKRVTVSQVEEACRRLSRHGVRVFAFMMLYQAWEERDGQLAWETTAEVENSLRFMRRMFRERSVHYMSWQICTPLPGSRLYDVARRHGLLPSALATNYEHHPNMDLPGISQGEMQRLLRRGILLKDWFIVRSGGLNLRHLGRVWENLRSVVGR